MRQFENEAAYLISIEIFKLNNFQIFKLKSHVYINIR